MAEILINNISISGDEYDNFTSEENELLDSILTDRKKISKKYLHAMVHYIDTYLDNDKDKQDSVYASTLTKERKKIASLLETIETTRYSQEDIKAMGISACTIKTSLQRVWIQDKINQFSGKKMKAGSFETLPDFKKYGLIPGQHIYYFGAFTGWVTGKYSFATHHFIYIYNGIIAEVGTESVKDCKTEGWTMKGLLDPRNYYKKKMSYFGLSTLSASVKWARDNYGQTDMYVYNYTNDNDKSVISARMGRAITLIGKWSYSLLLLSNNCENAANFISSGNSISSQAELGARLFKGGLAMIERNLKLRSDIPDCSDRRVYAERYLSKKGNPCLGDIEFDEEDLHYGGFGEKFAKCAIDKKYCRDCEDVELAEPVLRKVCKTKTGTINALRDLRS